MGVINTAAFAEALWPGINKWFGESYAEYPEEYTSLFDMETSTRAFEEDQGISGFGLANETSQGAGIFFDMASQTFKQRYQHKTYTLGYILTQEMLEDNQYDIGILGKRESKALGFSMRQTMEIIAANVYNRAFDTNYTFGDGKALCVSDHPTFVGGSFSNVIGVAADLSQASLEQAAIDIAGFKNDRGLTVAFMPKALIIPKELMFEAERILKSVQESGSANNDVNALRNTGAIPKVLVNHYLTDTDAWFIRTNCPDGMKGFHRVKTEFGMDNDFDTYNIKFRARFRVSFGNTDPRGIYGSAGA